MIDIAVCVGFFWRENHRLSRFSCRRRRDAHARDLPRGRRADGQGGSGVTRINAARRPSGGLKEGNAEMRVATSLLRGRLTNLDWRQMQGQMKRSLNVTTINSLFASLDRAAVSLVMALPL